MVEKKFIVTKSQLQRLVQKAKLTPKQEVKRILTVIPKVELLCNKITSLREGIMAEHYLQMMIKTIDTIKKLSKEEGKEGQILTYANSLQMSALNLYDSKALSEKAYPLAHDLYFLISSVT